jgi:hypothetical protein
VRWALLGLLLSLTVTTGKADTSGTLERFDGLWGNATVTVFALDNATVDDDSPRMLVEQPGSKALVIAEGGLVPLSEGLIFNKDFAKANLLKSKYLALLPGGRGRPPFLFVLGRAYASDPGSVRVVGIRDGRATLVLGRDIFEPRAFVDLDGDGAFELVGNPSYAQNDGKCRQTYDPFAVYRLEKDGWFRYSLALSKRFNEKHYYGWAGPKAREDVRVITCGKFKGRIVSVEESKKLAQ